MKFKKRIDVVGVCFAGGQSKRMGKDKRFLYVQGTSFLRHCLKVLKRMFRDVYVLTEPSFPFIELYGVPVYRDNNLYQGPFRALCQFLEAHPGKNVFAVAVDMPNVSHTVIRTMLSAVPLDTGFIFRYKGRFEPFPGYYPASWRSFMSRMVRRGVHAFQPFFEWMMTNEPERIHIVEPGSSGFHPRVFLNMNSPEDLKRLKE